MLVRPYGVTPGGAAVELYTLGRDRGLRAEVITYGATIVALETPDRNGVRDNVVLSLSSLAAYMNQDAYLGAMIGRYANRIGGASFILDGREYRVSKNEGDNCLHGGGIGFNKAVWQVIDATDKPESRLTLRHLSPDGDQGFPGAVVLEVTYVVSGDTLRIEYRAETDRPTVVNFTNHSYFNLSGGASASILDHEVTIAAEFFTPVDDRFIPTGEMRGVAGTPFDFRKPYAIGARIGAPDDQLALANGYDHNFVLGPANGDVRFAARARHPYSGRILDVHTSQPGVQFYSGNNLDGTLRGRNGELYGRHAGLAFETQHFPDSPNRPRFPSTVLSPGDYFISTTEYRFGVD
ncbi:MAG: aldose epimerase family protein [Pseudorhodoplanes sp.]|uniref:aldose epimerase family protein n=1 Tax=Pseudorhodoplanes sp. TaxID=1934341 RepID=UPI003D0EC5E0